MGSDSRQECIFCARSVSLLPFLCRTLNDLHQQGLKDAKTPSLRFNSKCFLPKEASISLAYISD